MPLRSIIARLEHYCADSGILVRRGSLHAHVFGTAEARCIVLRAGLNKAQQVLTLAHELTHIMVHYPATPRIDRTVCEYEAQAVERLVAAALGLRGDPGDGDEVGSITDDLLACSVKRVRIVAATIIAVALGEVRPMHDLTHVTGEGPHRDRHIGQ